MPYTRTQEIYARLREFDLPGEVWALFAELHNLQNMHPDILAAELRRSKDRERKKVSTETTETPIVILNNKTPGGGRGAGKGEPISEEFEIHWKRYPCKKSKGRARKAYAKVRKTASCEEIAAGIDRLVAEKREAQFWPYFATWLNDEGWLNEGSNVVAFPTVQPWSAVKSDYVEKYGAEAFKRYNEDITKGSAG